MKRNGQKKAEGARSSSRKLTLVTRLATLDFLFWLLTSFHTQLEPLHIWYVTLSTMLPLGTTAPDFELLDVSGRTVSLADFKDQKALVVAFICNHCPFVKHIADRFALLAREWQSRGVAVVAISSNDVATHPADSPEQMVHEAEQRGYTFPYLYDETQDVAKAYHAACTPDFFLFDGEQKLVYRGQLDDSRPGNEKPVTGADLTAAIDAALLGKPVLATQKGKPGLQHQMARRSAHGLLHRCRTELEREKCKNDHRPNLNEH